MFLFRSEIHLVWDIFRSELSIQIIFKNIVNFHVVAHNNMALKLQYLLNSSMHTDKETPNLSTFCRFWAPYEVKFGGSGQLPLLNKISSKLVQFYHCRVFLSFQGSIFKFYFITKHSFDI